MNSAIGMREDFNAASLRQLSRTTKSVNQARRLLALAEIDEGVVGPQRPGSAASLQIVRDWVIRFHARGPDGLLDGKTPGPRSRLHDAQRRALVDIVESGPILAIRGVVRWRLIDLAQWLYDEFAVSLGRRQWVRGSGSMQVGIRWPPLSFDRWPNLAIFPCFFD